MAFWKDLVDKVSQKKEELTDKAKRRAAKKATDMALETGKAAAKAAVKNAGKTLDYAGKKLEEAIFGQSGATADDEAPASKAAPDPFAKLKAEEAARKAATKAPAPLETEKGARDRERVAAQAQAKTEREVDDELAALKRKIRGG